MGVIKMVNVIYATITDIQEATTLDNIIVIDVVEYNRDVLSIFHLKEGRLYYIIPCRNKEQQQEYIKYCRREFGATYIG